MKLKSLSLIICFIILIFTNSYGQNEIVSSDKKTTKDFLQASEKFINGDYNGCISLYKSVLKKDSLLTKEYWYVLIDNLGMAYGITGDLKSAEQIFKYGLSKDSSYPLFYYSMACIYAEKNDMKTCIDFLTKAFKYKDNMISGEVFPDSAEDDSFQEFMKNDTFVSAVNKLKKQ